VDARRARPASKLPVPDPDRSTAPIRRWVDRLDTWRRRLGPGAAPVVASRPEPPAPAARRPAQPGGVWFRALFDHSADALLVCDARGKVRDANAAAATLFGRPAQELLGQPVAALLQQDAGAGDGPARLHDGDARARCAGGVCAVELRLQPVHPPEGPHWILQLRDTRAHWQAQERLSHLANYDSLTGLPNRALFRDRLGQAMARAQRSGRPMALMFIDLDRFKLVNDSLGHEVGDRLLQHVATTLTHCLRSVDSVLRLVDVENPFTLSRLGGDEFTVILEAVDSAEDAAAVARRILEALHTPFRVGDEEIVAAGSIGISMFPTDDVDLDKLVRHADMAMYRSKSLGRGTYSFFSDDLNAAVSARLSLEGSLRRAMERKEFQLFFQPKADLRSGEVCGVEALLRWHRPGQGMVPPDRFIGVLEDTGMILPVGAWVIRAACEQLAAWDKAGLPPLRMAVNLSARQFRHLYLASLVEDSLRENAIDPARLEIELTESLLMEDTEGTRTMLESFARIGVRLAIDDFGTGHSSLSYLKRFNIDTLKIDRSFVRSLPDDADDVAIATAVIALGRSMDMKVVAEGVETDAQADMLRRLGCDEMQGYLLGRPMPAAEFPSWYEQVGRARRQRCQIQGLTVISGAMPLLELDG
jgi:diguanylate cyclase (GGDEF)-like protein/PAS domain S-box-containing protein